MQILLRTCLRKNMLRGDAAKISRSLHVNESSRLASLDRRERLRRISSRFIPADIDNVTIHRFHETIGGRAYHIEVTPVSNRWRAQLCRTPGLPTAMMPFYGTTPDEAAQHLTKWLTLAHGRQPAGPATTTAPPQREPDKI